MTLTPEQAWQSALGQLQMEMPKASFETWVRDTRLVSYQDGLFTIAVRNAYAREWLESRLTSTVSRLLMGIMNRDVSMTFVIAPSTGDDVVGDAACGVEEKEDDSETAEVEVIHRLGYDEVVNPERIVAIPGYFSRLIPEIGARNAWLYVGWRQAVWDGKRQETYAKQKRIPVREIIRFSGLSRRTFFRAVEAESTWKALEGLVEKTPEEPHWARGKDHHAHRLPNYYTVYLTLPLSQLDAFHVQAWLEAQLRNGLSLHEALEKANETKELVGELLPPLSQPSSGTSPSRRTVMEIAEVLSGPSGPLPHDLQASAETLHRKIISAFGTILISHYFLETVIPNAGLTPAQGWLVVLMRDHCYFNNSTGEMRDEVLVRGGYAELAGWLGLNRPKTIWEWIRDEQGPESAFLCVLPGEDRDDVDSVRLRVRMEEPIFHGASGTISAAQMAPMEGASDTIRNGANGTHTMAEMAPLEGARGTNSWREWHGLKHLNTSRITSEKITPTTQDDLVAAVPSPCPAGIMPAGLRKGGTMPPRWVLRRLLIHSRVHPKVLKELLEKNASVKAFVSWLLYACSPAGSGIQSPLAYALASLRDFPEHGAGGAYDQLASLPPAELIQLVRWSIKRAGQRYVLQSASSGNEVWERTMGATDRLPVLLAILFGEEVADQTWERKETMIEMDGETAYQEYETIQTDRS
jgi:hypothetical protein